jgi:ATP-dependent Zn protease
MLKRLFFNLFMYVFLCFLPATTSANTPDFFENDDQETVHETSVKKTKKSMSDQLEAELKEIRQQVQKIAYCIQQVEQIIGTKILKITRAERTKILETLHIIKHILQGLNENGLQEAHPQVIAQSSYYVAYIALYLKSGLKELRTLSAEQFMTIMQEQYQKIERLDFTSAAGQKQVKIRIIKNKRLVRDLIRLANTLGLSKFNQQWRAFEKSRLKSIALLTAKYTAAGLIAYTSGTLLLHPQTKLPFSNVFVKDLWRPFGFGQTSHPFYQEQMNLFADQQKNMVHQAQQLAVMQGKEMSLEELKILTMPQEISFADGLVLAAKNIVSIPAILVALCSPLTVYTQKLWGHAFQTLSTAQDCDQVEKWAAKKINHTIAFLRGDITYQEHVKKEESQAANEPQEQVDLADIIGQEHLKELAIELADFVEDPVKYELAHIGAEAGFLLYGPPQTGKTMFAKALKTLLEKRFPGRVAFFPVTGNDLEHFSIDEIFMLAGRNAPCVLFIDEIEMLGAKRAGGSGQTTRDLLTNLNGLASKNISKNVFVIGATNQPEDLDYALLCKGRFGTVIPLSYPAYKNRVEYIQRQLEKRSAQHLSQDFIRELAEETEGRSYNDLLSIIDDAFRRSMRELRTVTKHDFDLAFDKQIRNILPLGNLTKNQETIISTYQIGLALMRSILKTQERVTCLTIHPVKDKIKYNEASFSIKETGQSTNENQRLLPTKSFKLTIDGYTFTAKPENNSTFMSDQESRNEILVLLAGQAALKLITGDSFTHYMPEHNAECLHKIKLSLSNGEKSSENVIREALLLKTKYEAEALALLEPHRKTIETLAKHLVDKKIIRSEEWQQLVATIAE